MPNEDGGNALLTRIFEALSDPHRRFVLFHLRQNGHVEIDDLAVAVAAWERGIPAADVSAETRNEVHGDLFHRHLPKLADGDIVEYDRRSATVCYRDPPRTLTSVLDLASTVEGSPEYDEA